MKIKKYPFRAEPFGRAFCEHRSSPVCLQIAYGLLESAKFRPITFEDNCMLPTVGEMPINGAAFYNRSAGIAFSEKEFERIKARKPDYGPELEEIGDYMRQACTETRGYRQNMTGYEDALFKRGAFWGGFGLGHGNPDYYRVVHWGTNGFRKHIEECRAQNPGKDDFYDACRITMDAVDVVGDRVAAMAFEKALEETDPAKKAEWNRIATTFTRIPREPAWDMYSAVQQFWLFFTFDGVDSPGRMDQVLIDYYRVSPEAESEEMITRMLEAIHNVRAWNLCISGSDANWNDETNELSYLILRKVKELKYQTPNLTMRVHRNTPDALWHLAAECLGTGIALPCIYNDEVVIPALEAIGIPSADAHEYCMNGCNQIDIMGKSHMGLEDGEVNMGKVLEYTLHNGEDYSQEKPIVLCRRFGDPCACKSFDELMTLFYKYAEHITDLACGCSNRFQEAYANWIPNPMRSCTIQGCLEKGRDYKNGGPLYGHGQILLEGIADCADSLWAIKKLIYDTGRYTMAELVEALEDDFVGHDVLYYDFSNCEKFGNDIEDCDEFCALMVDHMFKYLKTKPTFRGGIFTGGCSPYSRAAWNGMACGALPNGKHRGEATFAD